MKKRKKKNLELDVVLLIYLNKTFKEYIFSKCYKKLEILNPIILKTYNNYDKSQTFANFSHVKVKYFLIFHWQVQYPFGKKFNSSGYQCIFLNTLFIIFNIFYHFPCAIE